MCGSDEEGADGLSFHQSNPSQQMLSMKYFGRKDILTTLKGMSSIENQSKGSLTRSKRDI
jgi:hypothetical protein